MIDDKKIFRKFFEGQIISQQGYNYRFDKREKGPKDNLRYSVCWLPDYFPHSYFIEKLKADVYEIVSDRLKYLSDAPFDLDEVKIYTDKGDLVKRLYIKKSLLNKIDSEIKSINHATIQKKNTNYNLELEFKIRKKKPYPQDTIETIDLNFDLEIISVQDANGKYLKLNPALNLDTVRDFLQDYFMENNLQSQLDEIAIPILEPEMKIGDYEIYYNCWFVVRSILGVTEQSGSSVLFDLDQIFI